MGYYMANYGIILTYILLASAAIAAIVFPIMHLVTNPKKGKQVAMAIGALLVVYIIAYLLASDEVTELYAKFNITETQSKQVGTGLIVFYILAAGAVASALFTEVRKMINK